MHQIACSSCGSTLYSGFDLRNPTDVLKPLGYRCRGCGVKLSTDRFEIKVMESEGVVAPWEHPYREEPWRTTTLVPRLSS
jgi:DNA-directed RNA polymerase subunit RPC12/RpoP